MPAGLYSGEGASQFLSMNNATPAAPDSPRRPRRLSQALRTIGMVAATALGLTAQGGGGVLADNSLRFSMTPDQAAYWRFVTDGVMGGVSKGGLRFGRDPDGTAFARMTGEVSTANNGGFIQFRAGISFARLADGGSDLSGMRIRARGNGETYYVHIRTSADRRPWYYFAAPFPTGADWAETELAFSGFRHSSGRARPPLAPRDIVSIGIVARGRDHRADLSVAEISFF